MKKTITYRLYIVILASMVLIALVSYYFQVEAAQESAVLNSQTRLNEIKQILSNNTEEIEKLKIDFKEDYFIRAEAVAYIVQNNPEIIKHQEELKKVASLLQIDEFHLFDKSGILYAGTEPKYFNYNFQSGKQMQFFLPMLKNYDLKLCQEILPNTAENKLMQYVAVWREDRQGIVQIGMEPDRLLAAMKKNELSYIFSRVTAASDNVLFVADDTTKVILGATNETIIGKSLNEYKILKELNENNQKKTIMDMKIDGMNNHCVVEVYKDMIIGVGIPYQTIYQSIPYNMLLIVVSLLLLSAAIVLLILQMLDFYIIRSMYQVNYDMEKITAGDLDYRVTVDKLPEFLELSTNINHMVNSLLENTGKLSLILENVNIPIAVYEYNSDMKRVLATTKIGNILNIPEVQMRDMLEDQAVFKEKMKEICNCGCNQEDDIYLIDAPNHRYVKIRYFEEDGRTLGIIVDMTEEVLEKEKIKYERDVDLLTGLATRRAFFSEMDKLLPSFEKLKIKAMLMIDVDHLKQMNDSYGHENGDKLLRSVAEILKRCQVPDKMIGRLSGDEFVMFLYHMDTEEELQKYLQLMHEDMMGTYIELPDCTKAPVRFSCGYFLVEEMDTDYKAALKLADRAMYLSKRERKGDYIKYKEKSF